MLFLIIDIKQDILIRRSIKTDGGNSSCVDTIPWLAYYCYFDPVFTKVKRSIRKCLVLE